MLSTLRRSLRTKVVIIVLMTTFAALLVSTIVLLTYEVEHYRDALVADATAQADILARINGPALAFDDRKAAETNLALLNNRPNILAAAIYGVDGSLFATYTRAEGTEFPPLGAAGARFDASTITLFHPVIHNDGVLGTLYLQASDELGNGFGTTSRSSCP